MVALLKRHGLCVFRFATCMTQFQRLSYIRALTLACHRTSGHKLWHRGFPSLNSATMASQAKKQRTHPPYELIYWPVIPGRGEFIRLPLEASGVPYTDTGNEKEDGIDTVLSVCVDPKSTGDKDGNPPVFAPPALRVPGAGKDGKTLVIHQTPNILFYLGPNIDMAGEDLPDQLYVNQVALTALDWANEVHDTHHPVGVSLYYEDQKEESLKKSKDFRENRIPKFCGYFERVLASNKAKGKGKYLVGDKLTYADTTVWQVLDGLHFAFPKEIAAQKGDFPFLFETFYPSFKEEKGIKEYLSSKRRLPYSDGLFRKYPELDRNES